MLHQIGVGALGPVFRTYEPTRDRLVAVKVFRLDITPEQAASLAEELGRATEAGLIHESIVEPVAAGLEGTVAYRAEEYVAAESLDVAMRHYAPAALDKALPFITQLASAIDMARAAGVGHGALHPRDIFVTPDEARATGFGVVDALERLGLRAPVRRPYSPPERIEGKDWSTPADVFSLGAIAFELLTGRRPSGLGDQMGALSGANLGAHQDAIRAVLAKAMNEDPAARYATAGAFASALAAAAEISGEQPAMPAVSPAILAEPERAATPAASEIVSVDDDSESLDEFTTEGENVASIESPREAARKAIAARKRQVKPKPEIQQPAALDLDLDSAETLLTVEPEPTPASVISAPSILPAVIPAPIVPAPVEPVVIAGPDPTRDEDTRAPIAESIEPEAPVKAEAPAKTEEPVKADAPVKAEAPAKTEDESVPFSVAALEDVDLWHLDPVTIKGGRAAAKDIEPELPAATASLTGDEPRVDAPLRDTGDRVVAVDEFRAREAVGARAEKAWPRTSNRPMPSIAPVSRGVPPPPAPAKLLETNDVALVEVDEPEPEPERFAMMPLAIGLLLGLLLGYGPGYFVGWRSGVADTQAQLAQNTAPSPAAGDAKPSAPLTTPGTSGQSREFSDAPVTQAPGRTAVPNTSTEPAQRVPPAASTSAPTHSTAKVNPPPPAPTNPAPTKPSSNTSAVKPKPTPAAAPTRTSGTIVVKSSPAKAAVTVNGRWTGRTPLTLDDREFGEYVIRVVEPGYAVAREVFKLSAAAPSKTIDVVLKPSDGAKPSAAQSKTPAPEAAPPKPGATATGSLFVDSRPQGAKVILNGKPAGVTPLRLNDQPAGAYEVRLELADHQPWTATARIVGGETARVTGSMERIR